MMENKTRKQIEAIFLEVSRCAARKKLYALRAEQDGHRQLARLFLAIASSEDALSRRLLFQLRGQIGKNEQNCHAAFTVEIPGLVEHYQQVLEAAEKTGERTLRSIFLQSTQVARVHLSLKRKLDRTPDKEVSYHICTFCGFIMEENAPVKCPVCGASTDRFQKV